jgi:hypothetical protein
MICFWFHGTGFVLILLDLSLEARGCVHFGAEVPQAQAETSGKPGHPVRIVHGT